MPQGSDDDGAAQLQNVVDMATREPLRPGGGGGTSGGMEDLTRRVGALEADMKEVKSDLKRLLETVARIDGRVSQMPTAFQLLGMVVGIVFAVMGATFAMIRFGLAGP